MEETHRTAYAGRDQSFLLSPISTVFTNQEALWTWSLRVFLEGPFHRHDWSNHWPPVILNIQLLSLSQRLGVELEFPTFQSHDWFPGNQPPSLGTFPKSPHWHKLRCKGWKEFVMNNRRHPFQLYHAYHLGNPRGFRSCVIDSINKDQKYIFLTINPEITGLR